MDTLNDQPASLTQDKTIDAQSIDPTTEKLSLLIGADGVMVPFCQEKGSSKGPTRWHEVKVALVARIRPCRTKHRKGGEQIETQLVQRRLVACLGTIDDLGQSGSKHSNKVSPRRHKWFG